MAKYLPSDIQFSVGDNDYSRDSDLELVTSDSVPGGYDNCTFQLCNWKNRLPNLGDIIWIYNKTFHKTVWLGRVEDVDPTTYGIPKVTGRGYGFVGTTDRRFFIDPAVEPSVEKDEMLKYRGGMPLEDVIRDALRHCNDVWDSGEIVASGLQLGEQSQSFALQTPYDVFNFATALTSGFSTPLIWWVREAPNSNTLAGLYTGFMDNSARYETALKHTENDFIQSKYSLQGMINRSIVGWGKDKVQHEIQPGIAGDIDYSAIPMIRDKAVNAANHLRGRGDAQALGGNYLSRFNLFRALSDTITICESLITAKPPLFTTPLTIPGHLIRSGNGIYVNNMPDGMGRYNQGQKYIVRQEHNWGTGITTLQCGELVSVSSAIELINSFETNRLFDAYMISAASYPYADADAAPVYGPEYTGTVPTSFSTGLGIFVKDPNASGLAPFGAVYHPNLIWDEGIESNFVVGDLQSEGYKGAIRVIPGTFDEAEVLLGNGADFLVDDNCEIEVYRLPSDSDIKQLVFTRKLSVKRTSGIAFSAVTFGRREWVVVRVITASTVAEWASISLHAKKEQPGLKVNG